MTTRPDYGFETRLPSIPDPRTANLADVVAAIKETLEVRVGAVGDGLDRAVTLRDLLNSGMATPFDLRNLGREGVTPFPLGTGDTDPDIPPTPDHLEATGAIKYIILTWQFARGYSRLAYFEVWRSLTDVIADAINIGQTFAPIYADEVGPGKSYYYWVRAVSDAGVSPFNALSGTLGQTSLDVAHMLDLLTGQITESQLWVGLGDRIDLIDGAAGLAGSVAARVKTETDARVAAIGQEIADREAAIFAEAGARTTYVQTYTYSKAESDEALSTYAIGVQATIDTALSDAQAYARDWAYSKADSNSAEAAQTSAITANYTAYADAAKAAAISTAAADVRSYAYSKTSIDSAEAAQTSAITTNYTAYADAAKAAAISTAAADVRSYSYSKASVDGALASQSSSLTASYTSYTNSSVAAIAIGGRNMLVGSSTGTGWGYTGYSGSEFWVTAANSGESAYIHSPYFVLPGDTVITVSFESKQDGTVAGTPDFFLLPDAYSTIGLLAREYPASTAWVKNVFTLTTPSGWGAGVSVRLRVDHNGSPGAVLRTYSARKLKIELGNKNTDWTPAPEDVDANIAGAISTASADVRSYAYSKASVDGAFSSQFSSLTANYTSYADGAKNTAISTASADVRSYAYSQAATNSAISGAVNTVNARLDIAGGSGITIEQAFSANASAITGLSAQYTIKIDSNGYVSGFGLASTVVNGSPFSSFIVRADSFAIGSPSGPGVVSPSLPFIVRTTATTVNGESVPIGVYLADAYIANGIISRAKIGDLAVDDAKIANLSVAKLLAGKLGVGEYIESTNYLAGDTGFRVHGNGNAEFSNVTVRGTVYATAGQIGGNIINATGVQSPGYSSGVSGWRINSDGTAQFNDLTFRGTLAGPNGTLGTITAVTIQSAASGARSVMTEQGFRSYDGTLSLPRVEMGFLS